MPADVNVTEKVARAIDDADDRWQHGIGSGGYDPNGPPLWLATAALSTLADPEVLAGIAGVLREHGLVREAHRDPSYGPGIVCRCGAVVDQALDETMQETQARHEAAAVVEWLRGRA